jgi:choline kinase
VLLLQLRALARAGLDRATVVVGFGAEQVESFLAANPVPGLRVESLYNPFYATTDNLVTCWLSRGAMSDDFLLLNGDTLFTDELARRVLDAPSAPIRVTVDHKLDYDDDDMKVSLDGGGRLLAIGKSLPMPSVGAESIGMLSFRESGPKQFVEGLQQAIREPESMRRWYLSVVNDLAQQSAVETLSIRGLWWQEIDAPEDLAAARAHFEPR